MNALRRAGAVCALLFAVAGCHPPGPPMPQPPPPAQPVKDPVAGPGQGSPCPDGRCGPGLTCVTYYGVAGPAGPKLTSCEIPCPSGKCPNGQHCTTISDGPGRVCR